jgi:hypothetical protein
VRFATAGQVMAMSHLTDMSALLQQHRNTRRQIAESIERCVAMTKAMQASFPVEGGKWLQQRLWRCDGAGGSRGGGGGSIDGGAGEAKIM